MKKKYDLAVKCGSYEKDGETKNRYKNIGVIIEKDDGGKFMMIDPTVNFAAFDRGVDNNGNLRDMVLVSMFEPKDGSRSSKKAQEDKEFEE